MPDAVYVSARSIGYFTQRLSRASAHSRRTFRRTPPDMPLSCYRPPGRQKQPSRHSRALIALNTRPPRERNPLRRTANTAGRGFFTLHPAAGASAVFPQRAAAHFHTTPPRRFYGTFTSSGPFLREFRRRRAPRLRADRAAFVQPNSPYFSRFGRFRPHRRSTLVFSAQGD